MYDPWLRPSSYRPSADLPDWSVGARLTQPTAAPSPTPYLPTVALLGADPEVADGVRAHLHHLCWHFDDLRLTDLGNLRKRTVEFATPLLRDLLAADIIPLVLGADRSFARAQVQGFGQLTRQITFLEVDSRIRTDGLDLARGGVGAGQPRYHLAHLGSQEHLTPPGRYADYEQAAFDYVRLGAALSDLPELEPVVRDADVAVIDISAVQLTEAPARPGFSSSGFALRDASQLAYYAGHSDKLASFGLYGISPPPSAPAAAPATPSWPGTSYGASPTGSAIFRRR